MPQMQEPNYAFRNKSWQQNFVQSRFKQNHYLRCKLCLCVSVCVYVFVCFKAYVPVMKLNIPTRWNLTKSFRWMIYIKFSIKQKEDLTRNCNTNKHTISTQQIYISQHFARRKFSIIFIISICVCVTLRVHIFIIRRNHWAWKNNWYLCYTLNRYGIFICNSSIAHFIPITLNCYYHADKVKD